MSKVFPRWRPLFRPFSMLLKWKRSVWWPFGVDSCNSFRLFRPVQLLLLLLKDFKTFLSYFKRSVDRYVRYSFFDLEFFKVRRTVLPITIIIGFIFCMNDTVYLRVKCMFNHSSFYVWFLSWNPFWIYIRGGMRGPLSFFFPFLPSSLRVASSPIFPFESLHIIMFSLVTIIILHHFWNKRNFTLSLLSILCKGKNFHIHNKTFVVPS